MSQRRPKIWTPFWKCRGQAHSFQDMDLRYESLGIDTFQWLLRIFSDTLECDLQKEGDRH